MPHVARYGALGCAVLLPILLVLSPRPAHAQTGVAELSGTVTDPSGATVAGANVSLVETEKGVAHPTLPIHRGTMSCRISRWAFTGWKPRLPVLRPMSNPESFSRSATTHRST